MENDKENKVLKAYTEKYINNLAEIDDIIVLFNFDFSTEILTCSISLNFNNEFTEIEKQVILYSRYYTDIIDVDTIKDTKLQVGNNGTGNRWCNQKFIYTCFYSGPFPHNPQRGSGKNNNCSRKTYKTYSMSSTSLRIMRTLSATSLSVEYLLQQTLLMNFINKKQKIKRRKIIGIFIHDKNIQKNNRNINSSIMKEIKSKCCIICGSGTDIEADHKNYLYDDFNALNTTTQSINDFQPLCRHCNIVKREKCKQKIIPPVIRELPIIPNNIEFWVDPLLYVRNVINYITTNKCKNDI